MDFMQSQASAALGKISGLITQLDRDRPFKPSDPGAVPGGPTKFRINGFGYPARYLYHSQWQLSLIREVCEYPFNVLRGGEAATRLAHNQKIVCAIHTSATKFKSEQPGAVRGHSQSHNAITWASRFI